MSSLGTTIKTDGRREPGTILRIIISLRLRPSRRRRRRRSLKNLSNEMCNSESTSRMANPMTKVMVITTSICSSADRIQNEDDDH